MQEAQIIHDEQQQFQNSLIYWHNLISNADPRSIDIFGEKYQIGAVNKSSLSFKKDDESFGLKIIDIILYLYKKLDDGSQIKNLDPLLVDYLGKNLFFNELSIESISFYLEHFFVKLNNSILSSEQLKKGGQLIAESESRRKEKMIEYSKQKTLNFR